MRFWAIFVVIYCIVLQINIYIKFRELVTMNINRRLYTEYTV